MTYLINRKPQRYRRLPRKWGMGDDVYDPSSGILLTSDSTSTPQDPSSQQQCIDQANAEVAPFDQKIDDLAKNWNPTGFYSPDDVRKIISTAMATVQQGQSAVNRAIQEPNASQDSLMRATDDLARAGSRSLDYLQAAKDAEQQGLTAVNAPGLKKWVTNTMAAASSAMVTASTISCMTPWWVSALAAFQVAFDQAWTVIRQVVGAVLAIGETALKIAEDLPELYDKLKWVAVGLGVLYFWSRIKP